MPRTIAIGDVHGCSKALEALLSALRPGPTDLLVFLGDYVDRGPDSRGVIDILLAISGRCRLVAILGNHEQMMLEAIDGVSPDDWLKCGGFQTAKSYGFEGQVPTIPNKHVEFLATCLEFFENESHIFAHANYDADLPMNEQDGDKLRWESLSWSTPGPHHSGKRVILGHSAQRSGEILDLRHLVCIDTYCYGGGWLTALDVDTNEVWQADRDGNLRASNASAP